MLQNVLISNKYCSFELSIYQREMKSAGVLKLFYKKSSHFHSVFHNV